MVSISDISIAVLVSIIYLLILPLQLAIFPTQYYSVRDVIYSGNPKKATAAAASRCIFIFILCWILWLFNKKDSAIWGITIGSFMCAWPSIYHYQLFAFYKNKYKFLYFIACISSVFFSWACAIFSVKLLLPMLYENKGFYLIDNSGISTLLTILGFCNPFGLRKIIKRDEQENPYLVGDTFAADLYLTKRKMQLSEDYFDQFVYEIDTSAEKYIVSPELLKTVLQLEYINRGTVFHRIVERIAIKICPGFVIRKNASIGLAQIQVKNAQPYFHAAPRRYIEEMLKPEISIDLCAYMLQEMLEKYKEFTSEDDEYLEGIYDEVKISQDNKISTFIASQYICGDNNVLKKFILVYAAIISETHPSETAFDG